MKLGYLWSAFPTMSWFGFQPSPPSTEGGICLSISSGDFLLLCSNQMFLTGSLSILGGQGDWLHPAPCSAGPDYLCLKMQSLSALDSEAPKVRFWQLKSYPSQNFSICDALEKSALKLKGFDFYVT